MRTKILFNIAITNSNDWNNIGIEQSFKEKRFSMTAESIGYSVVSERISARVSQEAWAVDATFERIFKAAQKYGDDCEFYIAIEFAHFCNPASFETKKKILEKFCVKTVSEIFEEHGHYRRTIER